MKKLLSIALVFLMMAAMLPAVSTSAVAASSYSTAPTMQKKLLVIDFDPILETRGGVRFTEYYKLATKTTKQATEDYISRLHTASHGILNYSVTYETLDEFPHKNDGTTNNSRKFADLWDEVMDVYKWGYGWWDHPNMKQIESSSFNFDYEYYIDKLNLVERRNKGEFDEIWYFADFSGGYETAMVGSGAYWINGAAFEADCPPFRITSISKNRTDTPLENLAHSAEAILTTVYKSRDWYGKPESEMTTLDKFVQYDKVSPGNAAVGNCHYAPNSDGDYNWDNKRQVYSTWRDWRDNYPNLTGAKELVDSSVWGNGDNLDHKTWWFSCFPHVTGRDEKGFSHNWWEYYQNLVYTESLEIRINTPSVGAGAYKIDGVTNCDVQVFARLSSRDTIDVTFDSTIIVTKNNAGTPYITVWRDGVTASAEVIISNAPTEKPSSWAETEVNKARAANLVPQNLQSKYTQATTRAEFCALAVALYENIKGEITGRKTFTDTADINVEKMAYIGVVTGTNTGGTIFSPDTQLTREQAAVMLSRLVEVIGKPFPKQAAAFADNSSVSSWAVEGVGQVQSSGIMGDTGGNNFSPKNPYTREQSIITMLRVYNMVK